MPGRQAYFRSIASDLNVAFPFRICDGLLVLVMFRTHI